MSRRLPAPSPASWAPVVAIGATALLAGAARLRIVRRSQRRAAALGEAGSAYAPDPLTGDSANIDALDVAPV